MGVGKTIRKKILGAKRSIRIVTPYTNKSMIELLLKKAAEGVEVQLVTNSDTDKKNHEKLFRSLINQKRTVIEEALKSVGRYKKWSYITTVVTLLLAGGCLFMGDKLWWSYLLLLILPLLISAGKNTIKIYEYSYYSPIRLTVLQGWYDRKRTRTRKTVNVHSKIFIVDDETAFVGSVNFTPSGFEYNHEVLVQFTDAVRIGVLNASVRTLCDSFKIETLTLQQLGKEIYSEPIN